jgi:hypothetical protein
LGTTRTLDTPTSLEAREDNSWASEPVRRAVTGADLLIVVAAVRAERLAGRKDLFLCSRMARVEREFDGEKRWKWELNCEDVSRKF